MDNYGPCEMCKKKFCRLEKCDGLKVCKDCADKMEKAAGRGRYD